MSDKSVKNNKQPKPFAIILKRELKSYFTSPVAYIVMVIFLVIAGLLYFPFFFLDGVANMRQFFSFLPLYVSCFVPALTMRVYAEEKRVGSFETLMTLPVTEYDVQARKYLASLATTLIMIAPTILYVLTLEIFGSPEYGPIIGGYIGAALFCFAFLTVYKYINGFRDLSAMPFSYLELLFIFIAPIIAILGDYIESCVKRCIGLKDSDEVIRQKEIPVLSNLEDLMKGHGGFADRIDSCVLVACYALWLKVMPPT